MPAYNCCRIAFQRQDPLRSQQNVGDSRRGNVLCRFSAEIAPVEVNPGVDQLDDDVMQGHEVADRVVVLDDHVQRGVSLGVDRADVRAAPDQQTDELVVGKTHDVADVKVVDVRALVAGHVKR